jgi:hypothetical protein
VTLLPGANVGEFSREQLLGFLAGGLLLDGTALQRFTELGLEKLSDGRSISSRKKTPSKC